MYVWGTPFLNLFGYEVKMYSCLRVLRNIYAQANRQLDMQVLFDLFIYFIANGKIVMIHFKVVNKDKGKVRGKDTIYLKDYFLPFINFLKICLK